MTPRIPRIIHQIWLGPLRPPKKLMNTWVHKHPEWQYMLWSEKNIPKLKNQEAFDKSDTWHQKSDILRYEILHEYGGIFIDADEYCLRPIDTLFHDFENSDNSILAALEGGTKLEEKLIANGILACAKNDPFMYQMMSNIDIDQSKDAWETVGPKYLTEMVGKYSPDVYLLDSDVFFPGHYSDGISFEDQIEAFSDNEKVLGLQLWGSTTHAYSPYWYKNPIAYIQHIRPKYPCLDKSIRFANGMRKLALKHLKTG